METSLKDNTVHPRGTDCAKVIQVIAQLSGITQSAYARIEIGSRDPSVRVAKQIGKILDFPWTKFFE